MRRPEIDELATETRLELFQRLMGGTALGVMQRLAGPAADSDVFRVAFHQIHAEQGVGFAAQNPETGALDNG
jgi:hypothetical protein